MGDRNWGDSCSTLLGPPLAEKDLSSSASPSPIMPLECRLFLQGLADGKSSRAGRSAGGLAPRDTLVLLCWNNSPPLFPSGNEIE